MREEFERFSKIIAEHGGLPIDNDQLAASAVKDLVLDMGFDPYWASKILRSAINMVGQEFDLDAQALIQANEGDS